MNSIFIIAHAPLAYALRQCALHVFPDCERGVAAFDVQPNMPPEETLASVRIAFGQLPTRQVLVLTDVFGATPCNIAQKLVTGADAKLVAGVNLPMLLRTVSYRHEPIDALVARALLGGTQGVMQVAVAAPQNQSPHRLAKHDPNRHDHQQ